MAISVDLSRLLPPPTAGGGGPPVAPAASGGGASPSAAGGGISLDLSHLLPPPAIDAASFEARTNPPAAAAPPELQPALDAEAYRLNEGSERTGPLGSILNGMTFGNASNAAGLINAVVESLKPGGVGWHEGFKQGRANAEELHGQFAAQHPVLDPVLEATGMVATLPAAAVKIVPEAGANAGRLARMGERFINAAPYTAATGAASGYASGGENPTLGDVGRGVGEMAALGGAGEAIAAGGRGAWAVAKRLPGGIGDLIRAADTRLRPTAAAEAMIGKAVKEAGGPAPIVERMRAAEAAGEALPVGAADTSGMLGELAREAANASPKARAILSKTAVEGGENQPARLEQLIGNLFHYKGQPDEVLHQRARDFLEPLYEDARTAHPEGITSPSLDVLTNVKGMNKFIDRAKEAADLDARAGRGTGALIKMEPKSTMTAAEYRALAAAGPTGGRYTLDFWDHLQRQIRGAADKAYRSGNTAQAGTLREIRRQILAEVDRIAPEFNVARGVARSFKDAGDAFELGKKAIDQKAFGEREAAQAMRDALPEEQTLIREGYLRAKAQQYINMRSQGTPRKLFATPREERVARILVGDRDFRSLRSLEDAELGLRHFNAAVQGNSSTARQLLRRISVGALGGAGYGYISGGDFGTNIGYGIALRLGGGAFRDAAEKRMFVKIAEMLSSTNPTVVEGAARRIGGDPRMAELFRRFAQGAGQLYNQTRGGEQ